MAIRTATRSDVEALDRIALAAKAHWGYPDADLTRWTPELRTSPQSIDTWPTLVAESDGEILGFAQLSLVADPWELVALWVHPSHVGRGHGRQLMDRIMAVAFAAGQHRVHIDADPNALGFYLSCGAKLVGEVPAPISGDPMRVRPQLELARTPGVSPCADS